MSKGWCIKGMLKLKLVLHKWISELGLLILIWLLLGVCFLSVRYIDVSESTWGHVLKLVIIPSLLFVVIGLGLDMALLKWRDRLVKQLVKLGYLEEVVEVRVVSLDLHKLAIEKKWILLKETNLVIYDIFVGYLGCKQRVNIHKVLVNNPELKEMRREVVTCKVKKVDFRYHNYLVYLSKRWFTQRIWFST